MDKSLYVMPPEAVMLLVQAGMTILELDQYKKENNPQAGMSQEGLVKLAGAIIEGNKYVTSLLDILNENSQQQEVENTEVGPLV